MIECCLYIHYLRKSYIDFYNRAQKSFIPLCRLLSHTATIVSWNWDIKHNNKRRPTTQSLCLNIRDSTFIEVHQMSIACSTYIKLGIYHPKFSLNFQVCTVTRFVIFSHNFLYLGTRFLKSLKAIQTHVNINFFKERAKYSDQYVYQKENSQLSIPNLKAVGSL